MPIITFTRLLHVPYAICFVLGLSISGYSHSVETSLSEKAMALYESLPNAYFRMLLNNDPIVIDGQHLHPKLQYYLEARESKESNEKKRARQKTMLLQSQSRKRIREAVKRNWNYRSEVTRAMANIENRQINGPAGAIPIRIYSPQKKSPAPLPILVYFYGGGWTLGSLDAADRAIKLLANEAQVIVVSAAYRPVPEYKFPAAHEDAYAVFNWVADHAATLGGNADKVAIGGDSAGANMSVAVSYQRLQQNKPGPVFNVLYYPYLDANMTQYRSQKLFGQGFGLDTSFSALVTELMFTDKGIDADDRRHERFDPRVSPMQINNLSGMPPTLIVTAGFDMLRDQGSAYAQKLKDNGVPVDYINYPSLIHGFMQFSGTIDDARQACIESARLFGRKIRD